MFSKVLVPLDGSAVTQLILPYISQVAAGLNIPVSLLTVVETGSGESVPDRRSSLFKTVEKEAKVRLADTARQLAKDGVHAETTTAAGRPAEQIVGAAYREDCDFIAMSTHGQNVSIPGLLGSVADKVVHTSRVPVLSIAPARAEMYRGREALTRSIGRLLEPTMSRMMVPLDGSPLSELMLPYVENLARRLSLRVLLTTVVRRTDPTVSAEDSEDQTQAVRSAQTYLDASARILAAKGLNVDTRVLVGHAAVLLIELAKEVPQDIIAIATRGRDRWALGGVAEALVRGTGDPVLIVAPAPPPGPQT